MKITILALIELPHTSLTRSWLVSSVDLANLEALDASDPFIYRKPASE
jgi:hypothetical protein